MTYNVFGGTLNLVQQLAMVMFDTSQILVSF